MVLRHYHRVTRAVMVDFVAVGDNVVDTVLESFSVLALADYAPLCVLDMKG